jgi:lipase chaperone LimK
VNIDSFNPFRIACLYYFGDLQYWKLPEVAVELSSVATTGLPCVAWQGWRFSRKLDPHGRLAEKSTPPRDFGKPFSSEKETTLSSWKGTARVQHLRQSERGITVAAEKIHH